jgi:hypothetical protein
MTNRVMMLLSLAIFAAYACAGCAGQQTPIKSFQDMTHKERSAFFMKVYNSQFDDYQTTVPITPEQKKIQAEKYRILTDVWPMLQTYDMFVEAGVAPTNEEAIFKLINKLIELSVGAI